MQVTITITDDHDDPDSDVRIKVDFDPPIADDQEILSPAANAALQLMELWEEMCDPVEDTDNESESANN